MRRTNPAIGILAAFFAAPFAPRRVAALNLGAGPGVVWTVHLLGAAPVPVVGWLTVRACVAIGQWTWPPLPSLAALTPWEVAGIAGGAVFIAVLGAPLVALLALAWVDCDEPLEDAWRHALRTARMFTPLLIWASALLVPATLVLANSYGPDEAAGLLLFALYPLATSWMLRALLRAADVRPVKAVRPHDPLCEFCGYVLLHLPPEARCPECGTPIADSLDPRRRAVQPAGAKGDPLAAGPSPIVAAWTDAETYFSHLPLTGWAVGVRRSVFWRFWAAGVVGWLGSTIGLIAAIGEAPPGWGWIFFGLVSWALMLGVFCGWLFGAAVMGVVASRAYGRNLLHPVFLVAGHTSGYFVAWALLAAGTLTFLIALGERGIIRNPYWFFTVNLVVNALAAAVYVGGVWSRVRFVRYGNWALPGGTGAAPAGSAAASH